MYNLGLLSAAALAVASVASASPTPSEAGASNRTVSYDPGADMDCRPSVGERHAQSAGTPLRVVYMDQQVRLASHENTAYQAYRLKLLAPEALAAGNLTVTWAPATDT